MHGVITSIRDRFRLFRQPKKIGETLECGGKIYLILGIERYELYGNTITIWYTAQDLSQLDYVAKSKPYIDSDQIEFVSRDKFDSERLKKLQLGTVFGHKNELYKILEYSEIEFVGTDMKLSFLARPVYPIDRKQAKSKLLTERRKKLKLELI